MQLMLPRIICILKAWATYFLDRKMPYQAKDGVCTGRSGGFTMEVDSNARLFGCRTLVQTVH
eukprot:scaffold101006_cov31-Attheya_sp.AAC.1